MKDFIYPSEFLGVIPKIQSVYNGMKSESVLCWGSDFLSL